MKKEGKYYKPREQREQRHRGIKGSDLGNK